MGFITFEKFQCKFNLLSPSPVGASTGDKDGLRYLYEGDESFAPIPTFGVLLAQEALSQSNMITGGMPGFQVDLSKVGKAFIFK